MTTYDFPNDADGDALRRLRDDGSDLSKPHQIDFHVVVPNESAGSAVCIEAEKLGFKAKLVQDNATLDWTCWCTKTIVPDYSEIVQVESQLDVVARAVGGHTDGWGAFPVK